MRRMKRRTAAFLALATLLALNAALLLVQSSLALPKSLAAYLLGPKMVKAEVVVKDAGNTYDYRLDQGKIRAVGPSSITLWERTGEVVTVPVSAAAPRTPSRPSGTDDERAARRDRIGRRRRHILRPDDPARRGRALDRHARPR